MPLLDAGVDATVDAPVASVADGSTGSGTGTGPEPLMDGAVAGWMLGLTHNVPAARPYAAPGPMPEAPVSTCRAIRATAATVAAPASPRWGHGDLLQRPVCQYVFRRFEPVRRFAYMGRRWLRGQGPTWQWVGGPSLAAIRISTSAGLRLATKLYVSAGSSLTVGDPRNRGSTTSSQVSGRRPCISPIQLSTLSVFGTSSSDVFFSVYKCANGGQLRRGRGHDDVALRWLYGVKDDHPESRAKLDPKHTRRSQQRLRHLQRWASSLRRYVLVSGFNKWRWGALAYVSANEIDSVGCANYNVWNGSTFNYYSNFDFCDVNGVFGFRAGDGTLQLWTEGNNNFANGIRAWQFTENPKGQHDGVMGLKVRNVHQRHLCHRLRHWPWHMGQRSQRSGWWASSAIGVIRKMGVSGIGTEPTGIEQWRPPRLLRGRPVFGEPPPHPTSGSPFLTDGCSTTRTDPLILKGTMQW